jgi:hypothetical protein
MANVGQEHAGICQPLFIQFAAAACDEQQGDGHHAEKPATRPMGTGMNTDRPHDPALPLLN